MPCNHSQGPLLHVMSSLFPCFLKNAKISKYICVCIRGNEGTMSPSTKVWLIDLFLVVVDNNRTTVYGTEESNTVSDDGIHLWLVLVFNSKENIKCQSYLLILISCESWHRCVKRWALRETQMFVRYCQTQCHTHSNKE